MEMKFKHFSLSLARSHRTLLSMKNPAPLAGGANKEILDKPESTSEKKREKRRGKRKRYFVLHSCTCARNYGCAHLFCAKYIQSEHSRHWEFTMDYPVARTRTKLSGLCKEWQTKCERKKTTIVFSFQQKIENSCEPFHRSEETNCTLGLKLN